MIGQGGRSVTKNTQIMKTRATILKRLDELRTLADFNDTVTIVEVLNEISTMYTEHKKAVSVEIAKNTFEPIDGVDWDEWAHYTRYDLEDTHADIMDDYYNAHLEKYGFVGLDVGNFEETKN